MENSTIFSFDTLQKQTLVMNVQVLNIDQGFFSDLFQGLQKSYVWECNLFKELTAYN